ncbi:DUF4329 domain-containing protein [Chryseobacterium kwangjuense]|uniref:DUF4329 domain-containing protein n=1 Tax=Chryseobacterium kwangjuense TaxID=267125 RepID=A0ABW9K9M5_9FLAO
MKKLFSTVTTDYLDGFQYENETLKFFPTAGGYYNSETGKYVYNYTDHLGNTRLSYFKNGAGAENIEESNYYPFGLKHEGYNMLSGNPAYKYKYQGQELQETGFYSFKWRNYMPDVGRFFNVDPLTEEYPTWSPYAFSGNRVIDAREIEGLEPHVLFGTQDKAARNYGEQYNGKSISKGREYGAYIYSIKTEDGRTLYGYNKPTKGSNDGLTSIKDKDIPSNATKTADIHSHGKYEVNYDNNEFSPTDKKDNERTGLDGYIVTPDGSLKLYDPNTMSPTDTGSVVTTSLPSDQSDPNRQNTDAPTTNPSSVPTKSVKVENGTDKKGNPIYKSGKEEL